MHRALRDRARAAFARESARTPTATTIASSPHYRDLAPLWAAGKYFPLLYSRRAVEGATESRLVLTPGRLPVRTSRVALANAKLHAADFSFTLKRLAGAWYGGNMHGDPSPFKPLDPGRINAMDPIELQCWCRELDCTEAELKDALSKVGEHVTAVREHLDSRRFVAQ